MNMKKTIAAIAAASVAVSAMATTVSALDAKTLTYNLVRTEKHNQSSGKVTANFDSIKLNAGETVVIVARGAGATWDGDNAVSYEITGAYWDGDAGANKSFNRVFVSNDGDEAGYSREGHALMEAGNMTYTDGVTEYAHYVEIPVKAKQTGTTTSLVASNEVNIKVVATYKKLPANVDSNKSLNDAITAGKYGIYLAIDDGGVKTDKEDAALEVIRAQGFTAGQVTVSADAPAAEYTYVGATGVDVKFANGITAVTVAPTYSGGDLNLTYKTVTNLGAPIEGWVDDATGRVVDLATLGITATGTPQAAAAGAAATDPTTIVVSTDAAGSITNIKQTDDGDTMTLVAKDGTKTLDDGKGNIEEGAKNLMGVPFKWNADVNAFVGTGSNGAPLVIRSAALITAGTPTAGTGAGAGTAASTINITAAVAGHWDKPLVGVVVGGAPVAGDYIKIKAAVAATDTTGFRYSSNLTGSASDVTGAKEIKYPFMTSLKPSDDKNVLANVWSTDLDDVNDGSGNKVSKKIDQAAITAVINDAVINYSDVMFVFNTATNYVIDEDHSWAGPVGSYTDKSWEGVDYKAFGRHWWDSDPGYDANTVYINSEWVGNNLFEGALIINKNLTLSLGATDKFDWTATSLSFSWDAIQDAALTSNAYANYIQNMVLRTSATWYWDNFQVVLGATEEEEVGTTSPVEAEEEELEESEEEPEVEDEPEEEPEDEPEEEPEVEPEVAPADNPGTGNAPVALAVIPVALAAAAIVAKKRG